MLLGLCVWIAFHESGVHATVAGVILGLVTPARAYFKDTTLAQALERVTAAMHGNWDAPGHGAPEVRRVRWATRETVSPLAYLETTLHPWVGFAIMPLFALANAGVPFIASDLADPVAVAIGMGLVIGKPIGIVGFSWLAVRAGLAALPQGVTWGLLLGGSLLAGIGFTMALFISGLALDADTLDAAKVGVLAASTIAAALGMLVMRQLLPRLGGTGR